jgi:hypothetical protein
MYIYLLVQLLFCFDDIDVNESLIFMKSKEVELLL